MKKISFAILGLFWASIASAQSVSLSTKGNAATHTICDDGCAGSGGTSQVDGATFNLGVDAFTPGGGTYNTVLSALSSGVSAAFRINKYRALWISNRDEAGNEIGVTANPFFVAQATGTNLHMVCDSGCGSPPASADNSAFTFGTTNTSPVGFVVDDVGTNSVAENSFGAARMSATRLLYVDISKTTANTTAIKVDNSAVTQPVSIAGTVTTTGPLTDAQLRASVVPVTAVLTAGAAAIGSITNTAFIANAGTNLNTSNLFLDATYTGRMPAGASPASAESNTNTALSRIGGYNFIYNGSTWDRWTGAVTQSGTWNIGSITTLPSLVAGTALIGQTANTAQATTTNSTVTCYLTSAATTNATNCKASAGNLYGFDLINTTATLYYLRLYNLAAAPTCNSATGFVRTIPIPASATGAGITRDISAGEGYSTGLSFCLTGGGSSTDNTNAATGVYVTLQYK